MRKKYYFIFGILFILGIGITVVGLNTNPVTRIVSETDALTYLKTKYPELQSYPSQSLPPKSIKTEKVGSDIFVAFIQNGSGRPYLSARCFSIKEDATFTEKNLTVAPDDTNTGFSVRDCTTKPETTPVTTSPVAPPIPTTTARPGKIDSGAEGMLTVGPICPVEHFPPEEACKDKPLVATLLIARIEAKTAWSTEATSDEKGYFSQELTPGTYTVSSATKSPLPRLSPVTFQVTLHKRTILNLKFDSGIR